MKKFLLLLLVIPFLFITGCEEETDKRTHSDFDTWNDWLSHKYGKKFGWDADRGLGPLKAPITHKMSAEEYLFAKGINAGWNMGNTYDLDSNPRYNDGRYDLLFAGIKKAGFNVIRIPISWGRRMSPANVGTSIPDSFLDEMELVVTAAHKAGLVVFINTHHDKGYFSLDNAGACLRDHGDSGGCTKKVNNNDVPCNDFNTMTDRFTIIWTQIAVRFKDYGDWLMFEPINEPTIGNPPQWDGAMPAFHEVLNRWNQGFIDAVRDSGGNNEKRYLFFKSYAGKLQTSLQQANGFRIPTDPAGKGRLIFSYHSYVPQPLGLEGQNTNWNANFANQYTSAFIQARDAYAVKGIPVFLGETGATFHSQRTGDDPTISGNNGSSANANRNRLLLLNAMGHEARIYGVIPVLWDNGEATRGATQNQPNGETFALFRRKDAHDTTRENWGLPIDHTLLNGGSNPRSSGGHPIAEGNTAYNDPDFGVRTIEAFIDAVNGRTTLGQPRFDPPAGN